MKMSFPERFFNTVKWVLYHYLKIEDPADKSQGGYVTAMDESHVLHVFDHVGTFPREKGTKYCMLSREKAGRVLDTGKISSWATRNVKKEKYGGGIRAGAYAIAFSGLPEFADEALMVVAALKLKLIDIKQARAITAISKNPVTPRLAKKFGFRL